MIMNKTILITGASSGLGKTTAKLFARKGWNVVATMRNPAKETELAQLNNVLVTRLDVQDHASIAAAIEAGIARFGRIDALVNNAGFGLFGVFEAASREKIHEQFDVNVFGVMDVTRALLPHFRANQSGVILNISSGAGAFGLPMISFYCATKFALEGFSEALSFELASQNIAVKLIELGGVLTTNFGQRSGEEAAHNVAIADYQNFIARANTAFAALRVTFSATEEQVAQGIYDAATDGTHQLRYVVTDDIKPMMKLRRETSEQAYMDVMRATFEPAADAKSA
jgi:NAD(P)-dependent dehydrogenase (short-subunit alcohol dehydrogenase family)